MVFKSIPFYVKIKWVCNFIQKSWEQSFQGVSYKDKFVVSLDSMNSLFVCERGIQERCNLYPGCKVLPFWYIAPFDRFLRDDSLQSKKKSSHVGAPHLQYLQWCDDHICIGVYCARYVLHEFVNADSHELRSHTTLQLLYKVSNRSVFVVLVKRLHF